MSTVHKTITRPEQKDIWVKAQIHAGHYTKDGENIRGLIRLEQERSQAVESIRAALIEGEASGEPQVFEPEVFKREMRAKHG